MLKNTSIFLLLFFTHAVHSMDSDIPFSASLSQDKIITHTFLAQEIKEHHDLIVFSFDGEKILTRTKQTALVYVWDIYGNLLYTLDGHSRDQFIKFEKGKMSFNDPSYVSAAAFSHDGKMLVTGGHDGKILVWNAVDGSLLTELIGHGKQWVTALEFSPDDMRIASCTINGSAKVWDLRTSKPLYDLNMKWGFKKIAFSPDGKKIATINRHFIGAGLRDGQINIWNAKDGSFIRTLEKDGVKAMNACIFSFDSKRLITGSSMQSLVVWNVDQGTILKRINGAGYIDTITANIEGIVFYTAELNTQAYRGMWNAGKRHSFYTGLLANNWLMGFSKDGSKMLLLSTAGGIVVHILPPISLFKPERLGESAFAYINNSFIDSKIERNYNNYIEFITKLTYPGIENKLLRDEVMKKEKIYYDDLPSASKSYFSILIPGRPQ